MYRKHLVLQINDFHSIELLDPKDGSDASFQKVCYSLLNYRGQRP